MTDVIMGVINEATGGGGDGANAMVLKFCLILVQLSYHLHRSIIIH